MTERGGGDGHLAEEEGGAARATVRRVLVGRVKGRHHVYCAACAYVRGGDVSLYGWRGDVSLCGWYERQCRDMGGGVTSLFGWRGGVLVWAEGRCRGMGGMSGDRWRSTTLPEANSRIPYLTACSQ